MAEDDAVDALRFRARLLDAAGHAVIATDVEGRVLYANAAAERLYGWRAGEIVGRNILEVTPPPLVAARGAEILELLRRGEPWVGEFPVRRHDGTVFTAWVHDVPVFDAAGRLEAILGVSHDLDTLRRAEEERQRLADELHRAQRLEAVGRLATGVAHDFNNLLAVVGTHAELLRERVGLDPQAREDLDEIVTAVARAAGLTRQLLAYGRSQVLDTRKVDLSPTVSKLCARWARELAPDVALEHVTERVPFVQADPGRVEDVLNELLSNARDALAGDGAATIRVRTGSAAADAAFVAAHRWAIPGVRYAFVEVSDSGVGMDAETLERAFEPFYSTKAFGRGLGLATAFGVALQHEGMLEAQSAPGAGSTFTLWLPTSVVPVAADLVDVAEPGRSAAWPVRVLLVEDDEAVRRATEAVLRRRGHDVVAFADAESALAFVARVPGGLDVALVDLLLPDVPGWELARRLHALDPSIRLVLSSGRAPGDRIAALRATVPFHFLSKPVSAERLCAVLESVVGESRRAQAGPP